MGTWGATLYSDDYALDLRASIGAVCGLPYDGEQIVALLVDLHPEAENPADETCTTFWLVVADQLHRRGIRSPAQQRALEIIRDGSNLAMLARLGMAEADLSQRRQALKALEDELRSPTQEKARKTLKKPQPLLLSAGDVLVYPVDSRGNCRNPYITKPALLRFTPVGWDGCVVVATGRVLEYLAWYQIAPTHESWTDRPTLEAVVARLNPAKARPGTLSKNHLARMGLERIGSTTPPPVSPPAPNRLMSVTVSDISIANGLNRWANSAAPK